MAKRTVQEVNAGSMADIAFLLLIFFLVTTTMDTDMGLTRQLPPDITEEPPEVKKRNTLVVLVNRNNQLLVRGENVPLTLLRKKAKEFIQNEFEEENLPVIEKRNYRYFGDLAVTPYHVISLQSDRGTSYETYIAVQNELAAAYNELKNELAFKQYGRSYNSLKPEIQDVLDEIFKAKVSEAEPVSIGG
jgi:biopolymer transport protein ExbD